MLRTNKLINLFKNSVFRNIKNSQQSREQRDKSGVTLTDLIIIYDVYY